MKYIMIKYESKECVRYVPIIFPDILVHDDVAQRVLRCPPLRGCAEVRSAGFIEWSERCYPQCSGDSESLKVSSHPDDSRIIDTYYYLHGIV